MDSNLIFKRILKGSTVTVTNNNFYLDRYKSTYYDFTTEPNKEFIRYLIYMKILEVDSGNFEFHETHYKLNEDCYHIDDSIRHISLTVIQQKIDTFCKDKYVKINRAYIVSDIECAIWTIKKNVIRKQKLQNLKNLQN